MKRYSLSPLALAASQVLWSGLPATADDGNWTVPVPKPRDTSTYALTHVSQPGSRLHYISTSGSDSTGEYYLWDGTNIIDSTGSTSGAGGVYGTDPFNPNTAAIKPYKNWVACWPDQDGSNPGASRNTICNSVVNAAGRNGKPDFYLFKRGDSFDLRGQMDAYVAALGGSSGLGNQGSSFTLCLPGCQDDNYKVVAGAYGPLTAARPRLWNQQAAFVTTGTTGTYATADRKNRMWMDLELDGSGREDFLKITGTRGAGNVLTATSRPRYSATAVTYQWWRSRDGVKPAVALTWTGTNPTTITAASAVFDASDADANSVYASEEGRYIVVGNARFKITGWNSTTQVTGSVTHGAMPSGGTASGTWEFYEPSPCKASTDSRCIAGATSSTYTEQAADAGYTLRCYANSGLFDTYNQSAFSLGGAGLGDVIMGCFVHDVGGLGLYMSSVGGTRVHRNIFLRCEQTGTYCASNYALVEDRELSENIYLENGIRGCTSTRLAGTGFAPFNNRERNMYYGGQSGRRNKIIGNVFFRGGSGFQLRAGGVFGNNYLLENYFWLGVGDYVGKGYLDRRTTALSSGNCLELLNVDPTSAGYEIPAGYGWAAGARQCHSFNNLLLNLTGAACRYGTGVEYNTGSGPGVEHMNAPINATHGIRWTDDILVLNSCTKPLYDERTNAGDAYGNGTTYASTTVAGVSIDPVAGTITRASGDWRTMLIGATAGVWDGAVWTIPTGFTNSANNIDYRVLSVTATVITYDKSYGSAAGCVAESGATVTMSRRIPWPTPSVYDNVMQRCTFVISGGALPSVTFTNTAGSGTRDAFIGRSPAADNVVGLALDSECRAYGTFAAAASALGWADSTPRTLKRYLVEQLGLSVSSTQGYEEYRDTVSNTSTGMQRGRWNPRYTAEYMLRWVFEGVGRGIASNAALRLLTID